MFLRVLAPQRGPSRLAHSVTIVVIPLLLALTVVPRSPIPSGLRTHAQNAFPGNQDDLRLW